MPKGVYPRKSLAERFWLKVNKNGPIQPHMTTPCWAWTGKKNRRGYGQIKVGGELRSSSHIAHEFQNGPIPNGHDVLHRCDWPPCQRGDHLFTGTDADNASDRNQKDRQAKGAANGGGQRLSGVNVLAIRRRLSAGVSQSEIAVEFCVSQVMISKIATRKAWGWLKQDAEAA